MYTNVYRYGNIHIMCNRVPYIRNTLSEQSELHNRQLRKNSERQRGGTTIAKVIYVVSGLVRSDPNHLQSNLKPSPPYYNVYNGGRSPPKHIKKITLL